MNTPEYFLSFMLPWLEWESTVIFQVNHFMCGVPGATTYFKKADVETSYPGFIKTYEMLTSLGCNQYFVTCMLKFCILNANGKSLDDFLVQSDTLSAIETALAIGLSGEELASALTVDNAPERSTTLPQDMAFTTCC